MRFLRQSTASQEILLGPFVAAADGSAQTGLTIANTDIKLLVGGATSEANKNSGGGTHIAGGRYSAVLDATDTATVGILEVSVNPASGIPWNKSYYVLEEAVYDALFAASALGYVANAPVNVAQWLGTNAATPTVAGVPEVDVTHWIGTAAATPTTAGVPEVDVTHAAGTAWASGAIVAGAIASNALSLAKFATDTRNAFGFTTTGTLSGTHSDTTADLGASAPTSDITGQTLYFSDHDLSRLVTAYNTGTGVATFDSIGVTLANGNTWYRYPTAPSSGGSAPSAATVAAAVWDASQASHTTSGSFGELATEVAAILVDTGTTLDGKIDTIDNFLDTEMAAVLAAVDTEVAALVTAVDALPTNAELATALGTADDAVLAQIALVKAKTDSLTFTVANVLDANIQRINDVTITGDGSPGTEFGV